MRLLYTADTTVAEDENYFEVEFTEKKFDADGESMEAGIFEEEEPEERVKGGFQKPSSVGISFYKPLFCGIITQMAYMVHFNLSEEAQIKIDEYFEIVEGYSI